LIFDSLGLICGWVDKGWLKGEDWGKWFDAAGESSVFVDWADWFIEQPL
jgi:hypothetical protein